MNHARIGSQVAAVAAVASAAKPESDTKIWSATTTNGLPKYLFRTRDPENFKALMNLLPDLAARSTKKSMPPTRR